MHTMRKGLSLLASGVFGLTMLLPLNVQAANALGDVNGDSSVNASDATEILIDAARTGSGIFSLLSDAQKAAADANGDRVINSNDAVEILIYAAGIGSSSIRGSFSEFMSGRRQTQPVHNSMEDEIIAIVNQQRANYGLPALQSNDSLNTAAAKRAAEITQNFSHTRPNGSKCSSVLDEMGVRYYAFGENIACGILNAASVMDIWMDSADHRANILNPKFRNIGVGVAESGGMLYFVQVFTD